MPMLHKKPVIFGLSGPVLTEAEKAFFTAEQPLGFILFARNIQNPEQLKTLTASLQALSQSEHVPILVDQEGGRVARLREPSFYKPPAAALFGDIYQKNPAHAKHALTLAAELTASELRTYGFTANCAPVADLLQPITHTIIGDRSYGSQPEAILELAQLYAETLLSYGIMPIVKHIPGHGRAASDSHEVLPHVNTDLPTLEATDFAIFKQLAQLPWAMTAHVVYEALDPKAAVTVSAPAIDYIRQSIGFQGVLISDAIEMSALQGTLDNRAAATLAAGCDIVLHCSGKLDEMQEVASAIPSIDIDFMHAWSAIEHPAKRLTEQDFAEKHAALESFLVENYPEFCHYTVVQQPLSATPHALYM